MYRKWHTKNNGFVVFPEYNASKICQLQTYSYCTHIFSMSRVCN